MKRFCSLSNLRSYLLPAIAAIVLAVGPIACSSSGEGDSPTPALEGAAAGEESASGNAANNNATAGENANANANTEAANTAKPEGEASASNNPIGNEVNNAISGEGANNAGNTANTGNTSNEGGNEAATAATAEGALNSEAAGANNALAGEGAAGLGGNTSSPVATPTDANTANPFGGNNSELSAAPPPEAPPATMDPAAPVTNTTAPVAEAPPAATNTTQPPAAASTGAGEGETTTVSGPTSLPEMGSKMAYYVMRGDTLGSIAKKIYGSQGKWKSLQAENGLADANKIYPGDVIYFTLNQASRAFAEQYEMASRQMYTVARGDTLARLAAKFYGTQGAWRTLWKENPQILNPDRIRVGMTLSYRSASKVALKDDQESELAESSDKLAAESEGEQDEAGQTDLITASVE